MKKNKNILLEEILEDYFIYAYNMYKKDKYLYVVNCINEFTGKNFQRSDEKKKEIKSLRKIQEEFSILGEENKNNKQIGAFYTPRDIVSFINKNVNNILNSKKVKANINLSSEIFDPTCGNSEFLLDMFLYKKETIKNEIDIVKICKTLYGNDRNEFAIIVSKIRLFIQTIDEVEKFENMREIFFTIKNNFFNFDFIKEHDKIDKKFDIIIGNPPYVESKKNKIISKYSNIYAEVIENSIKKLKNKGILSFIVPISIVSTPRMKEIRKYMYKNFDKIVFLNYSDRPSSLFFNVHQKVTIFFGKKKLRKENLKIYTSNYKYWYNYERESLFTNIEIIENKYYGDDYITKLGNLIEKEIFSKIRLENGDLSLFDCLQNKKGKEMYLNMRAAFWIKVFMDFSRSNEYKKIFIDRKIYNYIYIILNSSLFFWYWTVISDCWHITTKELKNFKISFPLDEDLKKIEILSLNLSKKLEETKKYIGSKQIEYEYKHKLCKKEIDKIDDFIGKLYNLTLDEIEYIKNFAIKYRESRG